MHSDYTQRDLDEIDKSNRLEREIKILTKKLLPLEIIKKCKMEFTVRIAHDDTFLGWVINCFKNGYGGRPGYGRNIEEAIRDWHRVNDEFKHLCTDCAEFFGNVRLTNKLINVDCPTCGSQGHTFRVKEK